MSPEHKPYVFEVTKIGNPSIGYISIIESSSWPFPVERVYWTYFTPNEVIRGNHAHKKLKQVLIAVSGQITVDTEDRDGAKDTFILSKPNQGLFIPSFCWRTIQFSHNAVLVCLASAIFVEDEYIRNYEDFKRLLVHG